MCASVYLSKYGFSLILSQSGSALSRMFGTIILLEIRIGCRGKGAFSSYVSMLFYVRVLGIRIVQVVFCLLENSFRVITWGR